MAGFRRMDFANKELESGLEQIYGLFEDRLKSYILNCQLRRMRLQ